MAQDSSLPPIPAKRYFTIGEVSVLCRVKPHVLRYWENEFTQLRPVKRAGNRRYYRHHEVLMIRRICHLLYDQGFTIHGARDQLEMAAKQYAQNKIPGAPESGAYDTAKVGTQAALNIGFDQAGAVSGDLHSFTDTVPALSRQQAQWLVAKLLQVRSKLNA